MRCEFVALIENMIWSFYPRPNGTRVVRNKYVFKIKTHSDDIVECFNVRLVVKYFDKKSDINYFDTFSPIVKSIMVQMIL